MSAGKVGRGLAKAVGIDVDYRQQSEPTEFVHSAAASVRSIDQYYEEEPTVAEFLSEIRPSRAGVMKYISQLFPFYSWIFHYNAQWAFGDLIAGVTVGIVVIPQGMAYAELAELPVEYGLYTSFVGFILYWAFATSKDITIGTVAVMSSLVGSIVISVQEQHGDLYSAPEIARCLSVLAGAVMLFLGLTRLGWIVEFIPLVGITAFMTGAAINIAAGQVPKLMGISDINTHQATYLTIINTLKGLPRTSMDAALGLTAMFILYLIKWFCNMMAEKNPHKKKLWFFLGTLRMAFVILLYTLISFLVNMDIKNVDESPFGILGTVPRGFQVHSAPRMDAGLISAIISYLPATIIVLVIEHISISKSFGRVNNYTIDPSQELVAVGFTNVIGPFLGAYPATGSFSRTAIKSKAGVRTPLAGIWTAIIVLLALYALTAVFYYIPDAALAGLIIHAVGDLITPPKTVYEFWQVSPIEVFIFFITVIIMVFTDIETGVYFTVCASLAVVLVRMAKARGQFLGRVRIYRVNRDHKGSDSMKSQDEAFDAASRSRDAFIPLDRRDGSNPAVDVQTPYPGVIVFRFNESPTYFNSGHYMDILTAYAQRECRPTTLNRYARMGDRPWNNPGPRRGQVEDLDDPRPCLRAVILDCSAISNVDVTLMQALIDTRNQLDMHCSPDSAEWHVANLSSRWARRAFAAAGFGFPNAKVVDQLGQWKPIYSVAAIEDASDDKAQPIATATAGRTKDVESGAGDDEDRISSAGISATGDGVAMSKTMPGKVAALQGVNRPYFHIDVAAAVESAITHIRGKSMREIEINAEDKGKVVDSE